VKARARLEQGDIITQRKNFVAKEIRCLIIFNQDEGLLARWDKSRVVWSQLPRVICIRAGDSLKSLLTFAGCQLSRVIVVEEERRPEWPK
jgi:hypothetical protein